MGFTVIELLVVIGITGLLSSYLIIYSGTSREQLALSIEASRLAQVIARAKSLAISTYGASGGLCGYGLHVDYAAQRYSVVSFDSPTCTGLSALPNTTTTTSYTLAPEVRLVSASSSLTDVFFLPPDPKTVLNIGGILVTDQTGSIILEARGGSARKTIRVSSGGQITF
jgi:type II secretory pathway pseudopilin PulG